MSSEAKERDRGEQQSAQKKHRCEPLSCRGSKGPPVRQSSSSPLLGKGYPCVESPMVHVSSTEQTTVRGQWFCFQEESGHGIPYCGNDVFRHRPEGSYNRDNLYQCTNNDSDHDDDVGLKLALSFRPLTQTVLDWLVADGHSLARLIALPTLQPLTEAALSSSSHAHSQIVGSV